MKCHLCKSLHIKIIQQNDIFDLVECLDCGATEEIDK